MLVRSDEALEGVTFLVAGFSFGACVSVSTSREGEISLFDGVVVRSTGYSSMDSCSVRSTVFFPNLESIRLLSCGRRESMTDLLMDIESLTITLSKT